ncbi:hypothetical protein A8C56_05820 [Niabella ginsenosidivorans]|uniref:Uncharacterized protein n=1 Tax=Niabella ginsenosidivorans TaxID=1176587 RepID=A0A1A9I0G9_9BACT|nr:hypothetical protein [Niabella ginsenosidivorans]ANH80569.1 hypothetical protein A8C56_05820 [Niabella ginsenosidivorans]
MLSRDHLLAQICRFFETITKAKQALGDKQYELLRGIVNENFNETAVQAYIEEGDKVLSEEEYQYLLFQSELLYLQLKLLKTTGQPYTEASKCYLDLADKLMKADAVNFNLALHHQSGLVKKGAF